MSHHQKGLVLFTVIVLLAILTTLVLSLLQTVFLYTEASNQVAKRHQLFYQIEAAANQLQSLDESTVDDQCKVYGKASNDVMNLLQRGHGCEWVMEDQVYSYLLDDLGAYPCVKIKEADVPRSSHHWLISIVTKQSPHELLQVRIAKMEDIGICEDEVIIIKNGILSWRKLYLES